MCGRVSGADKHGRRAALETAVLPTPDDGLDTDPDWTVACGRKGRRSAAARAERSDEGRGVPLLQRSGIRH